MYWRYVAVGTGTRFGPSLNYALVRRCISCIHLQLRFYCRRLCNDDNMYLSGLSRAYRRVRRNKIIAIDERYVNRDEAWTGCIHTVVDCRRIRLCNVDAKQNALRKFRLPARR